MSSSIGRIALTGIGFVVGGAFGVPGIGAAVGGIVGNLLFPQKLPGVSGPRLGDQQFTSSTEGTAIPLVYGQHVVNGNFIWAAPLEEVVNTEEQGGKGGPTQEVTTYTYFLSFAVGLCEGTITGIPRIWENGNIIYDRRPQQDGETDADYTARLAASDELDEQMTIYYGDETQLPDPLIESHEGVGEVTAHRGLAYVVFERREVTDFGGRPAQYQFEVTRADLVYTPTTDYSNYVLYPWADGNDPRECLNDHEYRGAGVWRQTLEEAQDDFVAANLVNASSFDVLLGWSLDQRQLNRAYAIAAGEREILWLHFNKFEPDNSDLVDDYVGNTDESDPALTCGEMEFLGITVGSGYFWWSGLDENGNDATLNRTGLFRLEPATVTAGTDEAVLNNCNNYPSGPSGSPRALFISDARIEVRRKIRAPDEPCLPRCDDAFPDWPISDSYCLIDEQPVARGPWVLTEGEFKVLAVYGTTGSPTEVARYPLGPVLPSTDPNYNDEAYWTAARNAAITAGYTVPSTYSTTGEDSETTHFPVKVEEAFVRSYVQITFADYDGTSVGAIVRDQCERSGLTNETDFDVTELTEVIPGYKVERIMNGRDIIAPLRQYALFDGLETDKLYFPLRGGDIVATLTEDDLGAHEFGGTVPPLVEANRIEDVELPYAVRVRYADIDSEYQAGAQLATMKVTAGKSAVDIETTIAMDATAAIQMAEIIQQESVQRREDYGLNIGPHLLALTATDPILIPLRGELQRVVITEDTRQLPGIIEAKAVRDDASIYTSTATGTAGGAGEQTLVPIGDTDLVLIDSAALTSGSNDAGMFVAACGASDRWRGFGLFESTDGGSNYSRIAAYTVPATMGTLIDAIPEGPFDLWDYANSFTVAMDNGTLESRTQEEVTNGANAIFVGADGRWEVMQFADAVAEGVDGQGRTIYRLSTLLRGRQGTEWAIGTSQVGDRLALCVTTQRLTMEVARIGIERLFKAVSFGRTTESGPTQTITPQGVALKPYAPTLPEGQRDGSNNLDIYAVRRTRISGEWMDSDYVPLNEEIEAYEVDILDGASPETVLRTLSGTSFPIAYTAAQQTTDFGAPQVGIRVRIYQISTAVGRGYPCEAIL